jgi:hypothetical protein
MSEASVAWVTASRADSSGSTVAANQRAAATLPS